MRASILDLRRRMKDVLSSLDRNETVTILYRGKEKAVLRPVRKQSKRSPSIMQHPAFGVWKDCRDMRNVPTYVKSLRKKRHLDAV